MRSLVILNEYQKKLSHHLCSKLPYETKKMQSSKPRTNSFRTVWKCFTQLSAHPNSATSTPRRKVNEIQHNKSLRRTRMHSKSCAKVTLVNWMLISSSKIWAPKLTNRSRLGTIQHRSYKPKGCLWWPLKVRVVAAPSSLKINCRHRLANCSTLTH